MEGLGLSHHVGVLRRELLPGRANLSVFAALFVGFFALVSHSARAETIAATYDLITTYYWADHRNPLPTTLRSESEYVSSVVAPDCAQYGGYKVYEEGAEYFTEYNCLVTNKFSLDRL